MLATARRPLSTVLPRRPLSTLLAVLLLGGVLFVVNAVEAEAQISIRTRAAEVTGPLAGSQVRVLPFAASHVAVYWDGNPDAEVTAAVSLDGLVFGSVFDVSRDEVGEHRDDGRTYGAVLPAGGATVVLVTSDRPIGRLTVLALTDGERVVSSSASVGRPAGSSVVQPPIISRAEWGADESLRFDSSGREVWPPTFWPIQKLFVHHTAGQNNDPDPAATIRAIYYYHAITQGWGDIGYNFLIDELGRIFKGRHSHVSGSSEDTLSGEDGGTPGRGVTAGHAYGFNAGTVGVALLGTLTDRDATPAARSALTEVLAWKADRHAIDPYGSSLYTNPVNGDQKVFANIAGHRDVNATECPGGVFYDTLPSLRASVAARIAGTPPDTVAPSAPANLTAKYAKRAATLSWSAATDEGGSGVAGYEVYRSTSSSGPFTVVARPVSLTYTDKNLMKFRTYWYYVTAVDRAGNRSTSSNTIAVQAT